MTSQNPLYPGTTATLRALLMGHLVGMEPRLSDVQIDALVSLLVEVDEAAFARGVEEIYAQMRKTLAHFPGLLPAWWVVFGHAVNGEVAPACERAVRDRRLDDAPGVRHTCTLEPVAEP